VHEAGEFFRRRIDHVTKNIEKLQKGLLEKHKFREGMRVCAQNEGISYIAFCG